MRKVMIAPALAIVMGLAGSSAVSMQASGSKSIEIVRTGKTLSGQELKLPQGKAEMMASSVEIAAGGHTTIHQHPWSRFVYVERGPLRITNEDTKQVDELQTGQVFAEVIAQWHQGYAPGPQGARVVVIDLVPPGATNMVMKKP